MKKLIISILGIALLVVAYKLADKKDINFAKDLVLPERIQNISFSEYPEPPVYNAPNIEKVDAEVYLSNTFLQTIGDSIFRETIIRPLKINESKNDKIIIEKLQGIAISDHNTIRLSLKCKFKINELFSRITMIATEVVVEAVPIILDKENYPIDVNFAMTELKINDLPPSIEKGLAHLATNALNEIELNKNLKQFINLDIKKPQSKDTISPDFKTFAFKIEKSGLSLLTSIDEK